MAYLDADRRRFLGLAAASSVGLAGGWSRVLAASPRDADMVVVNARVQTVDPRMPTAQAFAVRDGRFIAVGDTDQIRSLVGKSTEVFDARGMAIVPGFIDCHLHAVGETLLYEVLVGNPYDVEFVTIDSIIGKLRERAAQTAADHWVHGYFFDDTKVKDRREITVRDLDRVSTTLPVMVHHRGGHTVYVNSKALALAGITRDTPNPFGGTFDRDASGALSGRVTDLAMNVFRKVGKAETFSPEQKSQRARDGLAFISRQFVRQGLTTVHHQGGDLAAMQQVRAAGGLLHRISYEASGFAGPGGLPSVLDSFVADGVRSGFGDDWIRIGATLEHTVDGSFSERTMAISRPYPNRNPPYKGNVTESQEDLDVWAQRIHRAGIQLNCHANGDVAIDMVLTAYERALRLYPAKNARPKITHCTYVNAGLIQRMKAMNAVPTVFSTYPYYNSDKFAFYGEEMMRNCIAVRSMLDAGIRVAGGSDFSPGPFSPLMAIQAMVTRTGWDGKTWGANQRVSIDEALMVNTLNGAYNSGEEDLKGSITGGKLADYVVLSDSLKDVASDKIKDITVVRTVTGGKVVHAA